MDKQKLFEAIYQELEASDHLGKDKEHYYYITGVVSAALEKQPFPAAEQPQDADLDKQLVALGYDPKKIESAGIQLVKCLLENEELKTKLKQEQDNHMYTRLAWDRTTEERDRLKATPSGITWVRANVKLPFLALNKVTWRLIESKRPVEISHQVDEYLKDQEGRLYERDEIEWLDESTAPSQGREVEFGKFLMNYAAIEHQRGKYMWWDKITGGKHYSTEELYTLFIKQTKKS